MGGQNLTLAVSRENPPDWLPGSMYHGPLLKNLRDTAHRAHTTAGHVPGSRRRPSARVPAPRSAFVAPRRLDAAGGGVAPAANGAGHSPTNAATRSKLPQPLATSPAAFVALCRDCSPKSAARTASRSRRAATRLCALSSVHFVAKSPISGYSCSLITSSLCIAQPPQWVALIFQICCPGPVKR